jgi:hypothetical protein
MNARNEPMSGTGLDALAKAVVDFFETGALDAAHFAEDLLFDVNIPTWRLQLRGRDAIEAMFRAEAPNGQVIESCRVLRGETAVVLEFVSRTRDDDAKMSRQICVAQFEHERIRSLVYYCTGIWDAALVARHLAEVKLEVPGFV